MGTVINYLKWRGDLTMLERPFNDIDNIILSMLIYVDFNKIRSEIRCGNKMQLSDAMKELLGSEYTSKCLVEIKPEFLKLVGNSNRFGTITISDYRDIYDKKRNCQFAALKFSLEDGTAYISFRGTDKTIVGWRENFMMSFKETDAQLEALTYIKDVIKNEDIGYRIGGHSKGGNLAVYASAKCNTDIQAKILEIYDNDGPGFSNEIIDSNLINNIKYKTRRIVPEYSVIGMLFELDVPFQIVKSYEKGINQHNPFSWQVEGERFITCDKINPQAQYLNKILNKWIEQEDMDHREIFVKQVFDAMEVTGAKEIGEIAGGLNSIEKVITEIFYSGNKTKKVIRNLVAVVVESFKNINMIELLKKRGSILGIVMIILGLELFLLSGVGLQVLGTGFVFAVFIFSIVRLGYHFRGKSRFKYKNLYVGLVYFFCVSFLAILAFHSSALILSINFILGITVFMYGMIKINRNLKNRINSSDSKKLIWIQSVTSIVVGIAILGIPYYYVEKYSFIIGLYIIFLGLSEIIQETTKLNSRNI